MPVRRAKPGADTGGLAHGTGARVGHYLELTPSPAPTSRERSQPAAVKPSGKGSQLTAAVPELASGPDSASPVERGGSEDRSLSWKDATTVLPAAATPWQRLVQTGWDALARVGTKPLGQREGSALEGISVSSDCVLRRD